jgi:hypothetical protein
MGVGPVDPGPVEVRDPSNARGDMGMWLEHAHLCDPIERQPVPGSGLETFRRAEQDARTLRALGAKLPEERRLPDAGFPDD